MSIVKNCKSNALFRYLDRFQSSDEALRGSPYQMDLAGRTIINSKPDLSMRSSNIKSFIYTDCITKHVTYTYTYIYIISFITFFTTAPLFLSRAGLIQLALFEFIYFTIHLNIIPSTRRSSKWSLSYRFPLQNSVCITLLPFTCEPHP